MLNDFDKDWLIETLGAMMELAGQQVRPAALTLLAGDLTHLPRPALELALADQLSVPTESITLGNGSNDVLDLIARA